MILRPVDASGDILPVLSSSDLVSDPESVVLLVRERLNLLSGEWWENPSWGCEIFDMIRSGRVTGNDVSALASYLSSYIAATPGVQSVEDVCLLEFDFANLGNRYEILWHRKMKLRIEN